jgi:hypothetical protein
VKVSVGLCLYDSDCDRVSERETKEKKVKRFTLKK